MDAISVLIQGVARSDMTFADGLTDLAAALREGADPTDIADRLDLGASVMRASAALFLEFAVTDTTDGTDA